MDIERFRRQNAKLIDYITINCRFRNAVMNAKTYPGADDDSDHNSSI